MKEQLERDIEFYDNTLEILKTIAHGIQYTSLQYRDKTVVNNQLRRITNNLKRFRDSCDKDTEEQREFKNKDFHVKVWQDSEKIGIETVWIREELK